MSEPKAGPGATVVVTGGSGKLGRACVRDLVDHGYDVVNVDLVPPREALCPFVQADLEDFGQALEVCAGVDDRPGRGGAAADRGGRCAPSCRPAWRTSAGRSRSARASTTATAGWTPWSTSPRSPRRG